jgi:hypothetical protein
VRAASAYLEASLGATIGNSFGSPRGGSFGDERRRNARSNQAGRPLAAHLGNAPAQTGDQLLAMGEMFLLGVQDAPEPALLQRQHVDLAGTGRDSGRVADDVDQPVERMQAAEQVVVLAIGAREERGEMTEAGALQALASVEALEARASCG